MILFLVLAAGIFTIAYPQNSAIHPGVVAVFTHSNFEGLQCEDLPDFGATSLESPEPSRSTVFSLRGSYTCHRPIFLLNERNPFVDRLLIAESLKAKRIASDVGRRLGARFSERAADALSIRVTGLTDFRLLKAVEVIYRVELAAVLGAKRLKHLSDEEEQFPLLVIELQLVDATERMSQARLILTDPRANSQRTINL